MTYEEAKEELVEVYCRFDSDCPYRKGIDCDTICPYGKAIEALEKQIPKKPVYSDYDDNGFDEIIPNEAKCPVCGYEFEFGMWNEFDNPYCYCGQAIDWSDVDGK